jgi:hypothetical protein
MILKILYNDNSLQEVDLDNWMFQAGDYYLKITRRDTTWEEYDVNNCVTEVIPYTNIYKWWTAKKTD